MGSTPWHYYRPRDEDGRWAATRRRTALRLSRRDQAGYLLGLVDLDVVPGAVDEVRLAGGEGGGEVRGGGGVEVAVADTEDPRAGGAEAAHVADAPAAGQHRPEQVIVQAPERRAGRQELLIQLRDEPVP